MTKMKIFLLAVFSFIQLSQCWPDFYYFSRNHTNGSILVNGSLTGSSFNKTLKTRFIVHGFNDNSSEPFLLLLKDGLLSIRDVNVILVDWAAGAIGPLSRYPIAASNAKIVGTKLANFIKQNNISAASSYCIGHSLGAHTCGFAGKALTTKFGRITGLDPAAPLFDLSDPRKRLDKTDASFVDCIHTSLLGIQEPICHQDYYPNGGYSQPGCPDITDFGDCSHWRSLEYFIETIIGSCEYKSVPCDNYVDYTNGLCPCNTTSKCPEMGYYSYEYNVTGSFYLDTINATPYCNSANVLYRGWSQLFYTLFIFILTTFAFSALLN